MTYEPSSLNRVLMVALQLPRKCRDDSSSSWHSGQRGSDLTLIRVRCRSRSAWPVISPTRIRRSCLVSRKAKLAWPGLNSLSISLAKCYMLYSFTFILSYGWAMTVVYWGDIWFWHSNSVFVLLFVWVELQYVWTCCCLWIWFGVYIVN